MKKNINIINLYFISVTLCFNIVKNKNKNNNKY